MKRINDIFSVNPLVDFLKNDKRRKNYILYAEGGIGKTTALLCLNQYYINQACHGEKIIPVFIDVKRLNDNEPKPLLDFIYKDYCGKDSDIEVLKSLLNDKLSFASGYEMVFLIDGYNEAGYQLKGRIRDEIFELKSNNRIRFIVSSRVNEIELQALGFSDLVLAGLSDEKIKSILGVEEINSSLLEILRIPLFMDKFLETYNKTDFDKINNSGIIYQSYILNTYIEKLSEDASEKKSERKDVLDYILDKWLPALAFEMVRNKKFTMKIDSVDELLNDDYLLAFFKGSQREQIKHIMSSKDFEPFSVSCEDFVLLGEYNGNLSFVHHVWRDFFAAKHVINIMNTGRLTDLEVDLDETIRRFLGEFIKKGDKCECDYEIKKDCNSESSPIEDFLQKHNLATENPLSAKATASLIEVMKIARNNSVTANFSNLDLTEATFLSCDLQNSKFNKSKLKESCFSPKGHKNVIIDAAFSDNGEWFVSVDEPGDIFVWNLNTDEVQCITVLDVFLKFYYYNQDEIVVGRGWKSHLIRGVKNNKFYVSLFAKNLITETYKYVNLCVDCSIGELVWYIPEKHFFDDSKKILKKDFLFYTNNYIGDFRFENSYDYKSDIKIFKNNRLIKTIAKNKFGDRIIPCEQCGLFATVNGTDIYIWSLNNFCCIKKLFGRPQFVNGLENGSRYLISLSDGSIRSVNKDGVLINSLTLYDKIKDMKVCHQANVLLVSGDTTLYVVDSTEFKLINIIDCFKDSISKLEVFEDRIILVYNACDDPEPNKIFYIENIKNRKEPIAILAKFIFDDLKYERVLDCFLCFYNYCFCVWDYKNNAFYEYLSEEKLENFLGKNILTFNELVSSDVVLNGTDKQYLSVYCPEKKSIGLVSLQLNDTKKDSFSEENTATLDANFDVLGNCIMLTSIDGKFYYADYIETDEIIYIYSIDTFTKKKQLETVYYINSREKDILLHCKGKYTVKYDKIKKQIKTEKENCGISVFFASYIEKNMIPVNILKTDFSDSIFIGEEKDKDEFYKILYVNGAKYIPEFDKYISDFI